MELAQKKHLFSKTELGSHEICGFPESFITPRCENSVLGKGEGKLLPIPNFYGTVTSVDFLVRLFYTHYKLNLV